MRRRWLWFSLVIVLILTGQASSGRAQDQTPPLVVFIEDKGLVTSAVTDPGPDSVTKLQRIFENLGARTQWQNLSTDLPADTRVVVLVRPLRGLAPDQLARLWTRLAHGTHLLLAIDPQGLVVQRGEGPVTAGPDRANSGLSNLLLFNYGIGLQDSFVTEPWFTGTSITSQLTTYLDVYAENVVWHPVEQPLIATGLPVHVWGARSLTVEPFGARNYAVPLLYAREAYGETNVNVFPANPKQEPLEINLGKDKLGHLLIGALGENSQTRSRVVVLGDSELLQNDFGLALDGDGVTPLYPGNWLLAERIAAWLLNLPAKDWPSLSPHFTWVDMDGNGTEWTNVPDLITDQTQEAFVPKYDIQTVKAFRDDSFLYILVNTVEPPNPEVRLTLGIENTYDGVTDVRLVLTADQVDVLSAQGEQIPVPDGQMAVGSSIEVRLPLRVVATGAMISELCLADSRTSPDSTPLDCTSQPPSVIPVAATEAPVEVLFPPGPRATVRSAKPPINIRSQPNTDSTVIDLAPNGKLFAAVGRNEAGDWIRVQNGLYEGWVDAALVDMNTDIMGLPVVQTP